ncbi:BQ5605_C016g08152 [Microbotryum silenes-dioicae]|uniref:BQ5605_C016g08152 protein n=1 Tax=Microbotryum silenes-dioicae TaxID=796604 RepID=A0A2X0M032_9BASI|nr:BQ5605_C016g08152 [Microbotryum silenes-dioicae]
MPTYADDEDFEDELFGTTAKGKARRRALPSSVAEMVESSSAVWHNDFFVPEEGGFPAYAVQVGGRPLGIDRKAWAQILPQEPWTTAGRLSTDQAFKYLLDCWGSSKRELIVLGVMPDLQGPTPESPHRPTKEKCLVKHQHVVDFHLRIDRVGVVPPKEVKNLVKDLYIVPLRKDTPLPDFLQVLDECDIPQNRETDLLLAVLVIQKNALPTVQPPVPTLAAPKTASPAPSSRSPLPPPPSVSASTTAAPAPTVSPASSSAAAEPVLPAFDAASLASLSSLLSNPSLIQSLASVSAAPFSPNVPSRVPTSFPPPPPPPGFVPPPGFSPLPPGTRGTNGSGGGWSPTTLAPLGSVSPYGATTPQWNGNSNPSNYSPHAIRDGRSPMHASASASSSSSTTGQGSGPLSNTGGIHPSRLALLEGAGMDGRDGRSHHPSSRDREQDSYRGGQRGSGWGARGRGGR